MADKKRNKRSAVPKTRNASGPPRRRKCRRPLTKKQRRAIKRRRRWKKIRQHTKELALAVVIAVTALAIAFQFFFSVSEIKDFSMAPELSVSDRLIIFKGSEVKRFDLILFKLRGQEPIIRRVIGLPGESVSYENDQLKVDGRRVIEAFLTSQIAESRDSQVQYTENFTLEQIAGAEKIPANQYLVLGDNRGFSSDSRSFGLVDQAEIIGSVKLRWFPIHAMEFY